MNRVSELQGAPLLGALGVGSVAGAFVVPRIRARYGVDVLVAIAAVVTGSGMVLLGSVDSLGIALIVLVINGVATMGAMSSFNLAVQRVLPEWVRGRGLAIYTIVFQVAIASGAAGWGLVAQATSITSAFTVGGCVMIATTVIATSIPALRLAGAVDADMATSSWPSPQVIVEPNPDDGPLLVSTRYRVDPAETDAFIDAAGRLGEVRRRDGALRWRLYRDLAAPDEIVETYLCESWAEHLRQRARSTPADFELWRRVRALHQGDEPPVAQFQVAARHGQLLRPITVPDAGVLHDMSTATD